VRRKRDGSFIKVEVCQPYFPPQVILTPKGVLYLPVANRSLLLSGISILVCNLFMLKRRSPVT
jgi:hypothetical protein